jgi:catechol 2,3-dioxygenase-like lactoylglutathione lyase family enzyme
METFMISNLQMITIYVRDMARSVEFYTEKLGFVKVAEYNDGKDNYLTWVMPLPASRDELATQIALQELADKDDPRIGSISGMVFTTGTAEEIDATYHELKQRGVHFTMELVRYDYGKGLGDQEARFVDPDGNEFLLHT